jgi:hypothetical protein
VKINTIQKRYANVHLVARFVFVFLQGQTIDKNRTSGTLSIFALNSLVFRNTERADYQSKLARRNLRKQIDIRLIGEAG